MHKELEIIMELMEDLKEKMSYGAEDFDERLGKKKPDMMAMEIEIEPKPGMEMAEKEGEEEMGMEDEAMGPDEMLKRRLEKMRG